MSKLDPRKVPPELRKFLPIAEEWGIDDDGVLFRTLQQASDDKLRELKVTVDSMFSEALAQWLGSPMAEDPNLITREYVAFTCLIKAAELATLFLEERASDKEE